MVAVDGSVVQFKLRSSFMHPDVTCSMITNRFKLKKKIPI